jgi:predicted phage terminase large subunit-like protein
MTSREKKYQEMIRDDFMSFILGSFCELNPQTPFIESPYIDLIASRLEASRRGEVKRLIINLPPRSLKSHIASVAFAAWLLGHKPSTQIICASYGQDLADKHARDCRTVMASAYYQQLFPRTRLSPEKQSVNDFLTTQQGFRMSTSVGGVLTGRGADFIILDDVLKPEDALSETRRTMTNDWYKNTLLSRLNNKETGVIIIVMQRLHQDDLVGHILAREDNWDVLSLPAIAEQDESYPVRSPIGNWSFTRLSGQALHPERDSLATLKLMRQTIGEYNFESQYQQSPVPLEGGLIKKAWLNYYEPSARPEPFGYVLQSWDTANKSGELNDFSVCTTWARNSEHFYLLDVFRKRLNYPDLKRAVQQQWDLYKPSRVLIEDKSSGISLIQELTGTMYGLEPYKPPPGSDKLLRLNAQSIRFESGAVLLPRGAPWLDEYVREITGFPGTKYDDQVDSTSQALEYLAGDSFSMAIWEKLGRMALSSSFRS